MSECDNAIECGKYEVQLQAAAQHLQDALDIGKIKAIGLMEVVTGIQQLIEERDELRSALFNARQFAVLCGPRQREAGASMKVIIAGCRDIDITRGRELVRSAISASGLAGYITEVIHGGARGIDAAAHDVCEPLWPVKPVHADWATHGKAAGPIRNRQMAAMADALIAVWDGKSRGTKNMIETARAAGLRVFVYPVKRAT